MKRNIIICSSFILWVFAILTACSSTTEPQIAVKRLFPEQQSWNLKQVSISDTDTNLDFKRVNCVWVVGNDNKPSDESRVTVLADKLVTLAPQDVPAITPDRYRDFKIGADNFSRKVVLTFRDNSSYTLLIGTTAKTKPAYVRLSDAKQVYRVDEPLLLQINLDSDTWLAAEEG